MKPEQFVREQGLKKAREVVEGAPKYAQRYRAGMYLKQGEWTWFWSETTGKWLQYEKHIYSTSHFDFAVDLSDLKRQVELLDIVRVIGPIEYTRSVVTNAPVNAIGYDTMYEGYFGEETKHYYENLRTFTIDQIKDAVAVHESIYGGGDE